MLAADVQSKLDSVTVQSLLTYNKLSSDDVTDSFENDFLTQKRKIQLAVDSYYANSSGISKQTMAVIRGMFSFYSQEQLVCENDTNIGITKGTVPSGDIESCLYGWEWLDNLVKKFKVEQDITDPTKYILADEQTEIDKILTELATARTEEESKLESFADTFWESGNRNGFIGMLEDRGKVLQTPVKKEIVKKIYVDKGIGKLVQNNGLDVPMPTYYDEIKGTE